MALKPKELKYAQGKSHGVTHAKFDKPTHSFLKSEIKKRLNSYHNKGDLNLTPDSLAIRYAEPFKTIHSEILKEHFSDKKHDSLLITNGLVHITRGHLDHLRKLEKRKEERKANTRIRRQEKKEIEDIDYNKELELLKKLKKKE